MSNNYNLQVDLTAVLANIATIDTVVDAIRATDVVNLAAQNTAIDNVVDAIRATDVPNIQTNINANETKIDTLLSKLYPQFKTVRYESTTESFTNALSVTGKGILYCILQGCVAEAIASVGILTIDGLASSEITSNAQDTSSDYWKMNNNINVAANTFDVSQTVNILNLEYKTQLLFQLKKGQATRNAFVRIFYGEAT